MSEDKVTLLLFLAAGGSEPYERLLAAGQAATTQDMVELALGCPFIDRVVVATNAAGIEQRLGEYDRVVVEMDEPGQPFHFGRHLKALVERYHVRRPLYFGGASAPLLSQETFDELCGRLLNVEQTVITNNIYGADFFGFTPPEALGRVELPPEQDNNLPYLLSRQGGLATETLDPAIENMFDVDTPQDLAILKLQPSIKTHVADYLERVALNAASLEAALPLLVSRTARKTLIGRVSTQVWGQAVTDMPGERRIYAEERSMKSSGRQARGEVRSLLGYLLEAEGPDRLFEHLASFSDAIFFDSRPLLYHFRREISAEDRFASDLGDVLSIQDPLVREFTAAAARCAVPVLLGGRNIVSGSLWALVQEAWNRADAGLISAV